MSAQPEPDIAVRAAARLGQAPTWDPATDTLLWVDVLSSAVHRYVPCGENHTLEAPQHVSAAKPRSRGGLVLHLAEGIALFEANGEQRTWLVYWAREGVRGGDAAVDSHGRLWASTMRYDEGGSGWLVDVDADGRPHLVVDGADAITGLAFSPDDARLHVVDSPTRRIDVFDVDPATGQARNRRPLCAIDDTPGEPAGLCVDAHGCVWVAVRGGGEIRRYTPDGALDRTVRVPVANPTGLCFGGGDLTDLYVTSARDGASASRPSTCDDAGTADDIDGSLLVLTGAGEGVRTPYFAG